MITRKNFLDLMTLSFLGLLIPPIELENEMQLADVWAKIANQARLTPQEMDFLKRSATETQARNNFIAGNTTSENKLGIPLPFNMIYSERLEKDKTSFSVNIPSGYSHLFLTGAGRLTATALLVAQFNDDTGNNYDSQSMSRFDSTQGGVGYTGIQYIILSSFVDSASSSEASNFFTIIPNYISNYYKSIITLNAFRNTTSRYTITRSGFWNNTNPIMKITISADSGASIEAGTLISIYGIA